VYRLWQAPFAEQKLRPMCTYNDLRSVRRVLDVGCGPGTNTNHFSHADYLGVDVNPAYVDSARHKYGRPFIVADVRAYRVPDGEQFDFILVNSLLHHLETPAAASILDHLRSLLTADGHVHVLDLVVPAQLSLARVLALYDRGNFARSISEWSALLGEAFEPVVIEPYVVGCFGATLWHMIYFKGRART